MVTQVIQHGLLDEQLWPGLPLPACCAGNLHPGERHHSIPPGSRKNPPLVWQ